MNRKLLHATVIIASLVLFSNEVFAGSYARGNWRTSDVVINSSDDWTAILSVLVVIPEVDEDAHNCAVIASADVAQPGPERRENQYRFTLSWNDPTPATNGGAERLLEFYDHASFNDPISLPVATTRTFWSITRSNGGGATSNEHTFYFLGRKVQEGDTNAVVLDASMSVICIEL